MEPFILELTFSRIYFGRELPVWLIVLFDNRPVRRKKGFNFLVVTFHPMTHCVSDGF